MPKLIVAAVLFFFLNNSLKLKSSEQKCFTISKNDNNKKNQNLCLLLEGYQRLYTSCGINLLWSFRLRSLTTVIILKRK